MTTTTHNSSRIPNVLTIAGSDSGGGAGIQADIKAISANAAYACSVVTAITAQNTRGVTAIHDVPLDNIAAQIDAVLSDINIHAVKIGMLSQPNVIQLVAKKITEYQLKNVVLDPVMVATSGDQLLQEEAIMVLQNELIPLVAVVTPNLHEAAILAGLETASTTEEMQLTAEQIMQHGASAVLLKGGHLDGEKSGDLLLSGNKQTDWFYSQRLATKNTHGTGCTLSSALAANLANGHDLVKATELAKAYIHASIEAADELEVGQGSGPVHHFHRIY